MFARSLVLGAVLCCAGRALAQGGSHGATDSDAAAGEHEELRTTFSDEPIPMKLDDVPDRPRPILELGDPFLGTGPIGRGFTLPTGAVWQPSLLVFGQHRSALQSFHDGGETFSEWVNRLDIFANLQLSGTERVLVGLRPLDENNEFTGYFFEPEDGAQEGWDDAFNSKLTHLFFEGDFGEIFPGLDQKDRGGLDLGFSVGRQPLFYQEGLLINDRVDAVGITKNNLTPFGLNNLQLTFVYGWNEVHRGDNIEDDDAQLFGLFAEADTSLSTVNFDAVYVHDDGDRVDSTDGLFFAASAVQRLGKINTAFRAMTSIPLDEEASEIGQGELLFTELSYTPAHSDDILYLNGFWAIDEFSSAARGPEVGGPLGRTGLLFEAVGIGRYAAPLGNDAQETFGSALGYQHFFDEKRSQIVVETGFRSDTDDSDEGAISIAARFQRAMGRNSILSVGTFATGQEGRGPASGARIEWLIKF